MSIETTETAAETSKKAEAPPINELMNMLQGVMNNIKSMTSKKEAFAASSGKETSAAVQGGSVAVQAPEKLIDEPLLLDENVDDDLAQIPGLPEGNYGSGGNEKMLNLLSTMMGETKATNKEDKEEEDDDDDDEEDDEEEDDETPVVDMKLPTQHHPVITPPPEATSSKPSKKQKQKQQKNKNNSTDAKAAKLITEKQAQLKKIAAEMSYKERMQVMKLMRRDPEAAKELEKKFMKGRQERDEIKYQGYMDEELQPNQVADREQIMKNWQKLSKEEQKQVLVARQKNPEDGLKKQEELFKKHEDQERKREQEQEELLTAQMSRSKQQQLQQELGDAKEYAQQTMGRMSARKQNQIKKLMGNMLGPETNKMMEQLMSGGGGTEKKERVRKNPKAQAKIDKQKQLEDKALDELALQAKKAKEATNTTTTTTTTTTSSPPIPFPFVGSRKDQDKDEKKKAKNKAKRAKYRAKQQKSKPLAS